MAQTLSLPTAVLKASGTEASAAGAIDILATLAEELETLAEEFGGRMKKLAKRIEETAMLVEAEREQNAEQLAKLSALQSLLKSLN